MSERTPSPCSSEAHPRPCSPARAAPSSTPGKSSTCGLLMNLCNAHIRRRPAGRRPHRNWPHCRRQSSARVWPGLRRAAHSLPCRSSAGRFRRGISRPFLSRDHTPLRRGIRCSPPREVHNRRTPYRKSPGREHGRDPSASGSSSPPAAAVRPPCGPFCGISPRRRHGDGSSPAYPAAPWPVRPGPIRLLLPRSLSARWRSCAPARHICRPGSRDRSRGQA